jgi:hypothetical protein
MAHHLPERINQEPKGASFLPEELAKIPYCAEMVLTSMSFNNMHKLALIFAAHLGYALLHHLCCRQHCQ